MPAYKSPTKTSQKRRAWHHDYAMPARYMLTLLKSASVPHLSAVEGDPRCMDSASFAFPHTRLLPPGMAVAEAVEAWQEKYPQIRVDEFVVMPDHVHLCIDVRYFLRVNLSRAVSNFMGMCTRRYHDSLPPEKRPPQLVPFFEKGFNDRIAYNSEQYDRQKNYVKDNPRRLLLKRRFPDIFFRKWIIRVGEEDFTAKGNIFLLRNPAILNVRFSRCYSPEYWQHEKERYLAAVENGGVLVSPFIHPEEKAVRDLAIDHGGSIIRVCENGFGERYAPQGVEMQLAGGARLLLVAPAEHNNRKQEMSRDKAMRLNALAAAISAGGSGVIKPAD